MAFKSPKNSKEVGLPWGWRCCGSPTAEMLVVLRRVCLTEACGFSTTVDLYAWPWHPTCCQPRCTKLQHATLGRALVTCLMKGPAGRDHMLANVVGRLVQQLA